MFYMITHETTIKKQYNMLKSNNDFIIKLAKKNKTSASYILNSILKHYQLKQGGKND